MVPCGSHDLVRVAPSHLRPISAFANSTERGKRRAHHRGRKTPNYVFRTRVERYQPEAGEYLYYFQSYTRSNIWIGKDILKRVCMRVSFFPGSFSCVLRYPAVRSLRSVCTAFAVINKSKYVMVIARRLQSNFFFCTALFSRQMQLLQTAYSISCASCSPWQTV